MSDGTWWVKALGIGGLVLGAVGIAALVVGGEGETGGTVPPDEIEGDDDGDDDELEVEPETVPGIFQK